MTAILRNPVFVKECRLFRRRWWLWMGLGLVAWIPITLMTRSPESVLEALGLLPATAFLTPWQAQVFYSLGMMFRADLLIGFFLVYRAAALLHRPGVREELAVTLLTAREIAVGKGLLPMLLLAALNLGAMAFIYGDLLRNPEFVVVWPPDDGYETFRNSMRTGPTFVYDDEGNLMDWPTRAIDVPTTATAAATPTAAAPVFRFHAAWPIFFFAVLEDLLYAALLVLVAMREYPFRRDPLVATFRAVGWMALAGVGILACSWAYMLVIWLAPWSFNRTMAFNPGLDMLMGNAVWFALVLPFEAFLVWRHGRAVLRRMKAWLADEA
ncbi:MAG: hypothetical protein KF858_06595 [Candidatus Sumerlaeia bacterium]|nr:hypothetical protein [Candidatus Sumerlaeia bacterium]